MLIYAVLLFASLAPATESFSSWDLRRETNSLHSLSLVPSQGSQLVAASSLVYERHEEDDDEDDETTTPASSRTVPEEKKARSFVSRVFSLPASFLHPHRTENEVLYPVVGFQYVEDPDSHQWRALPTVSNASCRLPSLEEELFGWYSSACKLSGTDDGGYCSDPHHGAD